MINLDIATGKERESIIGFTKDQSEAYLALIDFIKKDYDKRDYKRALIGAAGTGKTYLVKALIKNCGLSYSTIGLSAPTHKACRVLQESIKIPNIKVNTLQSDLGLRLNFDAENFDLNNPPFDPKGKIKIDGYSLYIVDESSMIPNNNSRDSNNKGKGLLYFLENICKQNKCKIIYIGDESQLPPVKENYSSAFKNITIHSLKQIVRQDDDNPVRHLLSMLRYDISHKTFTFLNYISKNREQFDTNNIKGYKVCNTNEFNQIVYNNFNDKQLEKNVDFCKIICYTNQAVSSWNKLVRNLIIKDAEKSIITTNDLILSYTTIVNAFNDCIIKNSEDYILKDVVNYTHPIYNLKGFMVRFVAIHGGNITTPLFVLDHKDKFSIQLYVKKMNDLLNEAKNSSYSTRAQRWRDYFTFRENCLLIADIVSTDGRVLFSRNIDYGFAISSHKSQGSTYDTALVDVNDIVYDKLGNPYTDAEQINRRLYVACSRCKNKLYLKFG